MISYLKNIRNNYILLIIFVIILLAFLSLKPINTPRLDSGKTDTISQFSESRAKSRRRRRMRKIVIGRYVITLSARNRDEGVDFPRIWLQKLAENRTVQQVMQKRAKQQCQQFRAQIRHYEDYLQAHPEHIQQLIEQCNEKIAKRKAAPNLTLKIKMRWLQLKSVVVFQYQCLRDMPSPLRLALGILFI